MSWFGGKEGLLKNIPHAGAVVTGLNMEELEEIYVLRRVLETLATKLAAKNIGKADLKLLELNNNKMEKAVEKKKYKTIIALFTLPAKTDIYINIFLSCGTCPLESPACLQ